LATPISYKGGEMSYLYRLVFEIWHGSDRQTTDDRCDDHFIRLLHLQHVSLKTYILNTAKSQYGQSVPYWYIGLVEQCLL